jgi:hypothetical protein
MFLKYTSGFGHTFKATTLCIYFFILTELEIEQYRPDMLCAAITKVWNRFLAQRRFSAFSAK